MDVGRVVAAVFQEIDPQAVEARLAAEVEGEVAGEGGGVAPDELRQISEGGVAARKVVERGVAGITFIGLVAAPSAAGIVVDSKRADAVGKIGQQRLVGDLRLVEPGGEQRADDGIGQRLFLGRVAASGWSAGASRGIHVIQAEARRRPPK